MGSVPTSKLTTMVNEVTLYKTGLDEVTIEGVVTLCLYDLQLRPVKEVTNCPKFDGLFSVEPMHMVINKPNAGFVYQFPLDALPSLTLPFLGYAVIEGKSHSVLCSTEEEVFQWCVDLVGLAPKAMYSLSLGLTLDDSFNVGMPRPSGIYLPDGSLWAYH